jgi:hypothetical protein
LHVRRGDRLDNGGETRAVWMVAGGTPASFNVFSWASMHMPQPLIAETASDDSSKLVVATAGLAIPAKQPLVIGRPS